MAERKKWENMTRKEKSSYLVVLAIIIVVLASIFGGGNKTNNTNSKQVSNTDSSNVASSSKATPVDQRPNVPAEYQSALNQADSYASSMHMSKQGVYDQLTSQYGGKFTAAAAQYRRLPGIGGVSDRFFRRSRIPAAEHHRTPQVIRSAP